MSLSKSISIFCAAIFLISCSHSLAKNNKPDTAGEANIIVPSHNDFGFKILKELKKSNESKNIFISPSSIAMALSMVYNGARGKTREDMAKALEFKDFDIDAINDSSLELMNLFENADPKIKMLLANSLWARKGFDIKKSFIDALQKYYQALCEILDFNDPKSADVINAWIEEKTNAKIKNVIAPPIDPLTVLFLVNAIYFKGSWSDEFDKKITKDDVFHTLDGTSKKVPMMARTSDYKYFETDDFQAISLPYGDTKRLSMYVFLPSDFEKFTGGLTLAKWDEWMSKFAKKEVVLSMPKFKLEYKSSLNGVLTALGMGRAFLPRKADFSGISEKDPTYISNVIHKSYIDVNEEGTEAAAVTVVVMKATSMRIPEKRVVMKINRPFFFVIRDNQTGANLFMGSLADIGK